MILTHFLCLFTAPPRLLQPAAGAIAVASSAAGLAPATIIWAGQPVLLVRGDGAELPVPAKPYGC